MWVCARVCSGYDFDAHAGRDIPRYGAKALPRNRAGSIPRLCCAVLYVQYCMYVHTHWERGRAALLRAGRDETRRGTGGGAMEMEMGGRHESKSCVLAEKDEK